MVKNDILAELKTIKKLMKRLISLLRRKPRIKRVNDIFSPSFIAKLQGKKDGKTNQVCAFGKGGHITPNIIDKLSSTYAYENEMYLKTALGIEPIISKIYSLVIELNLLTGDESNPTVSDSSEEAQRQKAAQESMLKDKHEMVEQILIALSDIKGRCLMIEESLDHHNEQAFEIFRSRMSNYWKGVLSTYEKENLEYFPSLPEKDFPGQSMYKKNMDEIKKLIDEAVEKGGKSA